MRKTTNVIVFAVFVTAGANMLEVSGVTAAMGLQIGVVGHFGDAIAALNSIQPGTSVVDSLFSIYDAVANTFKGFATAAFAVPILLINIGIPAFIVVFITAPVGIVVGSDLVYVLSGRDL